MQRRHLANKNDEENSLCPMKPYRKPNKRSHLLKFLTPVVAVINYFIALTIAYYYLLNNDRPTSLVVLMVDRLLPCFSFTRWRQFSIINLRNCNIRSRVKNEMTLFLTKNGKDPSSTVKFVVLNDWPCLFSLCYIYKFYRSNFWLLWEISSRHLNLTKFAAPTGVGAFKARLDLEYICVVLRHVT